MLLSEVSKCARAAISGTTPPKGVCNSVCEATTFDKIRSYAELQKLIRVSLRVQNPDWVEPNGDSPLCDSYEARFAKLLGLTYPLESDAGDSTV